ncbi:MAG: HAMP domain-containing histidine kinase [Thermomicrobiales bacterium]|nr:HAMP domain-containing histidine kinase [Thermomicrobiales bacterium]MCO5217946.1 HAMP domain-containing histidine kinase [Thermomicrobiales bacterium]
MNIHSVDSSVRSDYAEIRWQLMRLGAIVLALMFIVAVMAAWLLNRRIFSRIGNITTVAQTMDEHLLDARFETSGKNDEIDQMTTTINAALDRLQAGFERQRTFVRAASHELRTPLTVARTALEMPLVEGRVPPELTDDLSEALNAQSRLEQLLNTLLMLSRGDVDVPCSIALHDVLRQYVEQQPNRVPTITWRLNLEPMTAMISPTAFEIAMTNLLSNAVNHNRDQG